MKTYTQPHRRQSLISNLLVIVTYFALSFTALAHNKVVVVPLDANSGEPPVTCLQLGAEGIACDFENTDSFTYNLPETVTYACSANEQLSEDYLWTRRSVPPEPIYITLEQSVPPTLPYIEISFKTEELVNPPSSQSGFFIISKRFPSGQRFLYGVSAVSSTLMSACVSMISVLTVPVSHTVFLWGENWSVTPEITNTQNSITVTAFHFEKQ